MVLLQPPPLVEMAKRGAKFNYEDVYAELARQNKKGTVEDTLVDSILSREVRLKQRAIFRSWNCKQAATMRQFLEALSLHDFNVSVPNSMSNSRVAGKDACSSEKTLFQVPE
jgi:hypothetical protein